MKLKPIDSYIGIRVLLKLRRRIERIAKREFRGSVTAAARAALEEYADRKEAEAAAAKKRRGAK